mmetsp:Transcript_1470/g.4433  ORF Transcript_1470/g.4433 Transcript_1470/m.4433 type:complete len:266 (-) Transcript_1470:72-869(-)
MAVRAILAGGSWVSNLAILAILAVPTRATSAPSRSASAVFARLAQAAPCASLALKPSRPAQPRRPLPALEAPRSFVASKALWAPMPLVAPGSLASLPAVETGLASLTPKTAGARGSLLALQPARTAHTTVAPQPTFAGVAARSTFARLAGETKLALATRETSVTWESTRTTTAHLAVVTCWSPGAAATVLAWRARFAVFAVPAAVSTPATVAHPTLAPWETPGSRKPPRSSHTSCTRFALQEAGMADATQKVAVVPTKAGHQLEQ